MVKLEKILKTIGAVAISFNIGFITGTAVNMKYNLPPFEVVYASPTLPEIKKIPPMPKAKHKHAHCKDFECDDDITLLARAIYGEFRNSLKTECPKILISSILTRAERKKQTLRETILFERENSNGVYVKHYTCFNEWDLNYPLVANPLGEDKLKQKMREKIWEECYEMAREVIEENNFPKETYTNYFVSKGDPEKIKTRELAESYGIPSWAYQMKDGHFILEQGQRIPTPPKEIIKLDNGWKVFCYDFGNRV